jgi:orotidine-5'-phosphate decarboxylase
MNRAQLIANIRERESFLCVGLDTDPNKLPAGVTMLAFNKAIIDATRDLCVAYKPNVAFYECLGPEGWRVLEETVRYIGPDHFIIADAKRGDIGNTSDYYAKTFFASMPCDSVTVAPYMGRDSVEPFLKYTDKWAIVLALTSNPGADDFELLSQDGVPLYQHVLQKVSQWGTPDNTMFVVGATRPTMFTEIRAIVPDHFLLVPGVGAQGGSLTEVCKYGMNKDIGLLINASRSILYASSGHDFEDAARKEAKRMQEEMKSLLR